MLLLMISGATTRTGLTKSPVGVAALPRVIGYLLSVLFGRQRSDGAEVEAVDLNRLLLSVREAARHRTAPQRGG